MGALRSHRVQARLGSLPHRPYPSDSKDHLYNGLTPPEPKETVGQVIASFWRQKQAQLDTDDIAEVTFNEYETTCNVISKHLGKHFPVDSIDFADLRVALSKRKVGGKLGVATLKRRLTIARMVFGRQKELKDTAAEARRRASS